MRENITGTFTMPSGQVDDTANTVAYSMANRDKKIRGKVAKGFIENLTIEAVTDSHILKLIRRMMGSAADRFDAAFSVRHTLTDAAFNAYMHQQTNRKTLALWHGSFHKNEYVAIYEVHVGNQLDSLQPEPKHMQFDAHALRESKSWYDSGFAQPGVSQQANEFIVHNPAQCTVRYIVRINA